MYFNEGSKALLYVLEQWGIRHIFGVTGGGILEIVKHIHAYQEEDTQLNFLTVSEYAAGFAPIGYYLNENKIAAGMAVPGAATRLLSCGLSDAKVLRIPALYIVALNHSELENLTPLQDVGQYGMNILVQLQAEFGQDAVHFQHNHHFEENIKRIALVLSEGRPAVLCFHPDLLKQPVTLNEMPFLTQRPIKEERQLKQFVHAVQNALNQKMHIHLYVCSEAGFDQKSYKWIHQFQQELNASAFCTVNGSNACVGMSNFYGHVGIGGHHKINQIWKHLGDQDMLICLGMEAGDYHFLDRFSQVKQVWILTNHGEDYGFIDGSYQHRFKNKCQIIQGNIADNLQYLLEQKIPKQNEVHQSLACELKPQKIMTDKVDLRKFYEEFVNHLKPLTICFDDVCASYRDRQHVMTKPIKGVRFFSSQDSSAMGASFGFVLGAKIANPKTYCFAFLGDGCWRLIGGAMPEAADKGIVLFVLNNQSYGIVEEFLQQIMPELPDNHHHTELVNVDFVAAAKACAWDAVHLKPDLSNLKDVMKKAYDTKKSLLIEIPCAPYQELGFNPRANILKFK